MSSSIRSLQRHVARNRIESKGIRQSCKHSYGGSGHEKSIIPSWFAEHWRLYLPQKRNSSVNDNKIVREKEESKR